MVRFSLRAHLCLLMMLPVAFAAWPQGRARDDTIDSIETQIRARDYDQALRLAESALHAAPRDSRLWTLQGIALSLTQKPRAASRAFETALSISPNDPAALRGEVQILYQSQDQRAIPLLEKILRQDGSDSTAHEMLATLEARHDNCKPAVDQFALSGDATRTHPASLELWGDCLIRLHRPADAVPVFQQLSTLVALPAVWPRYDWAVALVEAQQNDAAVTVLQPIIASDHPDPDTLRLASDAYEALGQTPKAVALLRQAIVLNPTNPAYYVAFTALCMNHESFQVGIDMLDVGIRRIPRDPSLYLSRGLLYAQMAQYDRAEADFRMAELLQPQQSLSAYAMDLTDLQKNKPEAAIAKVRAQLKGHPESPLLHFLLAKLLWSQGNKTGSAAMAEAEKQASTAVALKPDLTEARDLLADIDISSGRYDQAARQCHLTLEQDPSDQTAIYHLIIALRHTEQGRASHEISELVTRLSALQQRSLEQETARKHFSLVESQSAPAQ